MSAGVADVIQRCHSQPLCLLPPRRLRSVRQPESTGRLLFRSRLSTRCQATHGTDTGGGTERELELGQAQQKGRAVRRWSFTSYCCVSPCTAQNHGHGTNFPFKCRT